jgi:hypothetical protein
MVEHFVSIFDFLFQEETGVFVVGKKLGDDCGAGVSPVGRAEGVVDVDVAVAG